MPYYILVNILLKLLLKCRIKHALIVHTLQTDNYSQYLISYMGIMDVVHVYIGI